MYVMSQDDQLPDTKLGQLGQLHATCRGVRIRACTRNAISPARDGREFISDVTPDGRYKGDVMRAPPAAAPQPLAADGPAD